MKKRNVINGIIILLVCIVLSSYTTNSIREQNNKIQNNQIFFSVKYNATDNTDYLQVYLKVYEYVHNWKKAIPILQKLNAPNINTGLPLQKSNDFQSGTFNIPEGKIYLIDIWFIGNNDNSFPVSMPQEKFLTHFYGLFSTNETFTIQETGHITMTDGTILGTIPPHNIV